MKFNDYKKLFHLEKVVEDGETKWCAYLKIAGNHLYKIHEEKTEDGLKMELILSHPEKLFKKNNNGLFQAVIED